MLNEYLVGFGGLIAYFLPCVICVLLIKKFTKVPNELYRKILHLVFLGSLFVFVNVFRTWWVSASTAILLAVAIFPVLILFEKLVDFSQLLTERKHGEIKRSLALAFGMFAVVISVCWGWLGDKWLVIASIFAWGLGDAAAALFGKRFGRHFLEGKLIEGRKSIEGTLSMFIVSFLSVSTILLLRGGLPWYSCATTALVTAVACAATELYTLDGFDTVTCPLAAAAVIIPFMFLWGGVSI